MAKTKLLSGDATGFLRAYCDEWKDVELERGVLLTMRSEPTGRRGVLAFVWSAWAEQERRGGHPIAQYSAEYPNSQVGTLEAFLYQSIVKLDRILRDGQMFPSGKA